ncbi:Peroxisomal acyl-coenzyme A oxidase [Lachnellula occidentalis]|uniref:Acyl-coenzyme A oxidase n=1 Tax=Lachnellula occidentalis TaxID=215460 RepID=A0A8H8S353_9HELO|nr:Peroxisomal acyl-coenzyme A oxidase [Lachnellula occidentalis]
MSPTPQWVKDLKPASPQGTELLSAERAKSKISVEQLSNFLFTKDVLERQDRILEILQKEKVFDKSQNYFDGRVDKFKTALARAKRLRQLQVQHKWNRDEYQTANDLISEPGPYGLHASMYLTTLEGQGTPEQQKKFLEPAQNYRHIGCYAQTELGHGSNVRGLETTATWNPQDKTFILHSPQLTASKWWIGSLGRTANHAVVMAQLIIDGKPYGPHPFVCQIRDMKTHEPLEGVHVGDIGPKFGYNTMDNGFLLLNKFKIPHINMLAKFSRVDPETNKYVKPSSPSLIYGTLTWVRSTIVLQSGGVLARGVTIATRYAAVRRQFQDRDAPSGSNGENQVLNYTMVQFRLATADFGDIVLPLLAATFALHFTGKAMMGLYQENQKTVNASAAKKASSSNRGAGPEEISSGSDLVADLHATSCGLKALGSTTAAEGLEVCRRAMGGHGYSSFSGVGSWYADYLPTTTWEGDNYMLTQQVARYLLKSARGVLEGNAPNNDTTKIFTTFLQKQDMGAAHDVLSSDSDLVAAFAWRTSFLTFEALKHRDVEKNSWNSLLVDFWRLSTAHSQYLVVKNFYDALQSESLRYELDPVTIDVLHKLFRLYALNTLEKEASEFYSSAAVTVRQIQLARTKSVMKLLEEIRPHALRLVDAWHFPDWQLDSSLGRKDGKVYEDMFYRASELNPLNGLTIDPYPDSDVLVKNDETAKFKSKL